MHISHRKIKTDNVREAELIQTQSVFSGTRLDGKQREKYKKFGLSSTLINEKCTQSFNRRVFTLVIHEPITIVFGNIKIKNYDCLFPK